MSEGPAYRANYTLVEFSEHLGANSGALDVPWAEFVGDRSTEKEFTVPVAAARDGYVTVQALDVGAYGHEILINGESLSGFDLPPNDGWQCWMDVVTGTELVEGTNTIQVVRDEETPDDFVIGTVRINWREPVTE
jgi:hypothetical protein